MNRKEITEQIRGGMIVSCQMEKHAPCYSEDMVELMVKAAVWGGACGLRINGIENLRKVRKITDLPIIGLQKVFRDDTAIFMTPNMEIVDEVIHIFR